MKLLRTMKFKNRIFLTLVLALIIPSIMASLLISIFYKNILIEKINNSVNMALMQMANNVVNTMDVVTFSSTLICLNDEIEMRLSAKNIYEDKWYLYQNYHYISERIRQVQNSVLNSFNAEMAILDFKGRVYKINSYSELGEEFKDISRSHWFQETKELNGRALWGNEGAELFSQSNESKGIIFSRLIKGSKNTGGSGILLVYIPRTTFWRSVKKSDEIRFGSTLILNKELNTMTLDNSNIEDAAGLDSILKSINNLHDNVQTVIRIGETMHIVNSYPIARAEWTCVHILPYDTVMSEVYVLEKRMYIFNFAMLILMISISISISNNITNPIKKLKKSMLVIQDGDFSERVKINTCEELNDLGKSFNKMAARMDELIKKVEEETVMRENAHLEALQAQINPHFLLNTLNSIKWVATMSGSGNTADMISELGKLLEESIYHTDDLITVEKEIELLHSYVVLQKMRYGDNFVLENRITDEKIKENLIPKFTLQPLVENSIIHGFNGSRTGTIIIDGYINGDSVVIQIEDDGVGISKDKLNNLLLGTNTNKGRFSGIGLGNVHERLRLKLGEKSGLSIKSEVNAGTVISVFIPILSSKVEKDENESSHCR